LVIEMVDAETTQEITARTKIPVIGIGAGPHCDGQILVAQDVLGLTQGKIPSFAKQYADLGQQMEEAFRAFAEDIRDRKFPS
ncbi:MAG TPA: 3-methyl-2-oxobutanoate hydroxymethyltransferase, partial [Opitutales bacterium]|nr:3-methyl-2-oxobutanoate hydroxymethyltransferase [Opitutales bacterium]